MLNDTSNVVDERQARCESQDFARTTTHYRFLACERTNPRRAEAEAFVRARFQRAHGARILTFMPTLLLMTGADDAIDAVAGCRSAEREPLFLERYLKAPIEEAIATKVGARVARSQIVELGNFAATDSRLAKVFMSFVAPFFLEREHTWIVFTATDSIRRILASLGARCAELAPASGECVANDADQWGRYYSRDPRVMAGYLPSARRIAPLWRPRRAD